MSLPLQRYTVTREKGPDGTEYEKRTPYEAPQIPAGTIRILNRETGNPLLLTPGQLVDALGNRVTKATKDEKLTPQNYRELKNPLDHHHATLFATAEEAADWARLNVTRDSHRISNL